MISDERRKKTNAEKSTNWMMYPTDYPKDSILSVEVDFNYINACSIYPCRVGFDIRIFEVSQQQETKQSSKTTPSLCQLDRT